MVETPPHNHQTDPPTHKKPKHVVGLLRGGGRRLAAGIQILEPAGDRKAAVHKELHPRQLHFEELQNSCLGKKRRAAETSGEVGGVSTLPIS